MIDSEPPTLPSDEISEAWSDYLRARGQRLTTPRKIVFQASQQISSPFSAEELLVEARKRDGMISLPTIYRNLPLLLEAGILRKASRDDQAQLYANDPPGSVEIKLICRESGREKSLKDDCLRLRMQLLAKDQGLYVERIEVRIEGVSSNS